MQKKADNFVNNEIITEKFYLFEQIKKGSPLYPSISHTQYFQCKEEDHDYSNMTPLQYALRFIEWDENNYPQGLFFRAQLNDRLATVALPRLLYLVHLLPWMKEHHITPSEEEILEVMKCAYHKNSANELMMVLCAYIPTLNKTDFLQKLATFSNIENIDVNVIEEKIKASQEKFNKEFNSRDFTQFKNFAFVALSFAVSAPILAAAAYGLWFLSFSPPFTPFVLLSIICAGACLLDIAIFLITTSYSIQAFPYLKPQHTVISILDNLYMNTSVDVFEKLDIANQNYPVTQSVNKDDLHPEKLNDKSSNNADSYKTTSTI